LSPQTAHCLCRCPRHEIGDQGSIYHKRQKLPFERLYLFPSSKEGRRGREIGDRERGGERGGEGRRGIGGSGGDAEAKYIRIKVELTGRIVDPLDEERMKILEVRLDVAGTEQVNPVDVDRVRAPWDLRFDILAILEQVWKKRE
jgi:hypothetical protein